MSGAPTTSTWSRIGSRGVGSSSTIWVGRNARDGQPGSHPFRRVTGRRGRLLLVQNVGGELVSVPGRGRGAGCGRRWPPPLGSMAEVDAFALDGGIRDEAGCIAGRKA